MSDNFFGFDTQLHSVLGRPVLEEELLTGDVEEEYDALNDETFGHAANDDWEEAHEKLSELIVKNNLGAQSVFNDSLLENDESQDEIVSKSISQLGLEDDLDDPAIMTVARNCHSSSRLGSVFGPSPPPPAFLETEICGSPKTHSIWSTTSKDSGITSFLQSIGQNSNSLSHQDKSATFSPTSDSVFSSPPKAWRAEELEKDLLSSSNRVQNACIWPPVPQFNGANITNKSPCSRFQAVNSNQNKIGHERMLTREEVERRMLSDSRISFPPKVSNYVGQPLSPLIRPNMISPIGSPNCNLSVPIQSSPAIPLRAGSVPLIGGSHPIPERPFLSGPYGLNARITNMMHNQMRLRGPIMPNFPLGFNHPNLNLNHESPYNRPSMKDLHPFFKQFMFPMAVYNKYFEGDYVNNSAESNEDEYAGLMTQREKEWLIRIQLLLLKFDNPYVEDYYYTTQVTRKCKKKYSENASKGAGDAPELILPETSKHENKTYVPTQFEGSLGKLQAVSVNFPRKVLDITVTRALEDDEGRVVTNQSLMKYRRLLLDIEKLYSLLLEIEDEERRILAKPDTEDCPHRRKIAILTKNIFSRLFCDNAPEDNFQNIMDIRKGRSLVMRAFKIFSPEEQLHCLVFILRCLSVVLKRDQNDLILVQHCKMITDLIYQLPLPDIVKLGEALESGTSSEPLSTTNKEKNNFITALKSKFGSSVICCMLQRAESLYCGFDLFESDIQGRWAKIVLNLVDCICALVNSSVSPPDVPCDGLLAHFQRFAVDREKFELLKEKFAVFEVNSKNEESADKVV